MAHEDLFGDAAAHQDRDLRLQVVARVGVPVRLGQLHRHAKRAAARDDRHLVEGIRTRQHRGDDGVTRLVVCAVDALVLAHDERAALHAHEHFVARGLQVVVADLHAPVAGGEQRAFVDQVREVGAGEAGRAPRDAAQVDAWRERYLARVHAENRLPSLQVRVADDDLPIEASGP